MGAVTRREMLEIEAAAFRAGATAESLMEDVGRHAAFQLLRRFPTAGRAIGIIGKGNNGGDVLVMLRHLAAAGWDVEWRSPFPEIELGVLPRRMLRRLAGSTAAAGRSASSARPLLVLDGLLGIGGKGPLRPPLVEAAAEIRRLRQNEAAMVVAVDVPSGVDADTGAWGPDAVRADLTLMVGLPKVGLLASGAVNHVGRLELVPVDELPLDAAEGGCHLVCPAALPGRLVPRNFDFHKGQAGRLAIVAGSEGMEGAAAIAATGGLRAGAGLVTLFTGAVDRALLARSLPPEVMVRRFDGPASVLDLAPDAIAAGPGLGTAAAGPLFELMEQAEVPMVIDADALNLIARERRYDLLRENRVITPHPGEMRRLMVETAELDRE